MGVVVLCAALATACGGGARSAVWPERAGSDLVPSGITLAGGTGSDDVTIDAAGAVWVDGPWQVTRVDARTGQARTWDAADDVAFASVRALAPAQPAGVWLDSGDRVRLFDGERFAVDVEVPDEYAADAEELPRGEVLQVGDALWASGAGGVGRWRGGAWSPVGSLTGAGPLAVDSTGAVWVGAARPGGGGTVLRFDGTQWASTGPGAPTGTIVDIAADPAGGVWVASAASRTDDNGMFRHDGTAWARVGPGGLVGDLSVTGEGEVWALASAGAGIDPAGESFVARLGRDGTWAPFDIGDGAPRSGELSTAALAAAGDLVVVAGPAALVRFGGTRFEPLWSDPAAVVQPAHGLGPDALVAVSAEEVWLPAMTVQLDAESARVSGHLGHYDAGAWRRVAPDPTVPASPPLLASDGALWQVNSAGLIRVVAGEVATVDAGLAAYSPVPLAAGADGAVWVVDSGSVVAVAADGARTPIGRPAGWGRLWQAVPLAGRSGVLWIAGLPTQHEPGRLARWDGRWTEVALPDGYVAATQLLLAGDGSVWATLEGDSAALGRYDESDSGTAWALADGAALGLAEAPDGSVCTLRSAGPACYPPDGPGPGGPVRAMALQARALSIAADGATWVLGEQVARLPSGFTP